MPASVRSACAHSVPARRLSTDLRPTSSSFRIVPPLNRRQQARNFRPWWSSPWDPDHSRQRRALLQKYAKLRSDAWGPQWALRHSFPPLIREMEKFEKWVTELEAELAPQQAGKPHHRPQSWPDSCTGHPPSRRWGSHNARFQDTGRDGPCGPKGDSGPGSPGSYRSKDKPVEQPRESEPGVQVEKMWARTLRPPKHHVIDPVTNRRVPKAEPVYDIPHHVEPYPPSTAATRIGPESAEVGIPEGGEGLEHKSVDPHYRPEQLPSQTQSGKDQDASSPTLTKNGKTTVEVAHPKPQATVMKTDVDGLSKGSPPSKGAETSADTLVQKEKPRMTGNYVKDFPEEFSETWTGCYRPETSVDKKPSTERLEPALNRTGESAVTKPKQEEMEPEVERRTTHDELIEQIRDIYLNSEAAHEVMPHKSTSAPSESRNDKPDIAQEKKGGPLEEEERHPDLYKVLVYDRTAETVDAVDVTSVVPDDMGVLTPAEAVTKLSNPAKFLPHFGPLQAQGYEIVSGEEDVLVFRKTRDATEPGTVFLRGTRYASLPEPKASSPGVNPIDMMGSDSVVPNTGNFASPTGYANYGELEREEGVSKRKPPPPFRDASEVDYEGSSKGRRGPGVLWRASVGAVWVAGLAYGASVVSEYFTTGGENGKGSKGRLN